MSDKKIVSFSDYIKRKQSKIVVDKQLLDSLSSDIKAKPELIEWYNFQRIFNSYKLFLHALYTSNHRNKNPNPNVGYFVSFSEIQIDTHIDKIAEANEWLERKTIFVDARHCTFKNMAKQLCAFAPRSTTEAWEMFIDMFLKSHNVVVIAGLSKSTIPSGKSDLARSLIKINDDAHFKGIKPKSDLIFVDSAAFLERSWDNLCTYINIFT